MNYSENTVQKTIDLSDQFDQILYRLHAISMMDLDGVSEEVSIGHLYLLQDVIDQIEQLKDTVLPLAQGEAKHD